MSAVAKYRQAFHGTSKAALPSILKEGIIPAKSQGADAWAEDYLDKHFSSTTDQRGVYLSTLAKIAATFSQFAAEVRARIPAPTLIEGGVVLEIDMTQADPSLIEADEQFDFDGEDEAKAMVYHGHIPPSWIKSWCDVHPAPDGRMPNHLSTDLVENPPLVLGAPVKVAA